MSEVIPLDDAARASHNDAKDRRRARQAEFTALVERLDHAYSQLRSAVFVGDALQAEARISVAAQLILLARDLRKQEGPTHV
jgi:hypothetical protein